jgi:ubiquinone/menaquinone biosynthesis C-methylase UbiE
MVVHLRRQLATTALLRAGAGCDLGPRAAQIVPHPDRVLDVGCGTGTLLRKAAERFDGAEMVGVDPESGMVEAAGEAWLGDRPVRFVLASAERPPF